VVRGENFMAVLDAPSERRHRTGDDAGAFPKSLCCLAGSGCPDDLVTGGLEAFPHC
jgi:hypothetical protein